MKSSNRRPKPLATIGTRPKVEIHRARFRPFESMKYLNLAALKRAGKARIEIGRIEGGGMEATLMAEVSKGMITKITPLACKGCLPAGRSGAGRRTASAATKRVLREALERVRERGYPVIQLPMPLTTRAIIEVPIGPIIVVIGPGIELCVVIEWSDGEICIYCLFSPGLCVGPIIVQ